MLPKYFADVVKELLKGERKIIETGSGSGSKLETMSTQNTKHEVI